MAKKGKRRILTIDGGGLRGILPATFLANLEESTGRRIVDHFDLIVGTSTGGIIALGLGLGLSAREIANFYVTRGPSIFGDEVLLTSSSFGKLKRTLKRALGTAKHAFSVKHDSNILRSELELILNGKKLGDSKTRLVIPAYDNTNHGPYVFKTAHNCRLSTDYRVLAVDVAMATAAAPTYFKSHNFEGGAGLIDGGIWANNPMGLAAVEAAAVLDWDMNNTWMLSLGCSEKFMPPRHKIGGLSALCGGWIVDLMFRGQDRSSYGTAKLMLRFPHERPEAIIRVNPELGPEYNKLDDASILEKLSQVANSLARHHLPQIDQIFFQEECVPFEPFYKECHV